MIEFLKNEWEVLSNAPLTFVSLFIAAVVLTATISSAFWGSIIAYTRASLEAKIEGAESKLTAAESSKVDLEQRLGFYPRIDKYSKLTHSELARTTLELCDSVDEKASKWIEQNRIVDSSFDVAAREALSVKYKDLFEKFDTAAESKNHEQSERLKESAAYQAYRKEMERIRTDEEKMMTVDRNKELELFSHDFAELLTVAPPTNPFIA